MNKLELSRKHVMRLERKLSDARDAIIMDDKYPVLSPDKTQVTLSRECYDKIVKAINIYPITKE